MSSSMRTGAIGVLSPISRTSLILAILLTAGCSSDVTRFGYESRDTTSSLPRPSEPTGVGGYTPQPRGLGLTEAPLPPPDGPGTYRVVGREYSTPPPGYSQPPAYHQGPPQEHYPPPVYQRPPSQAHLQPPASEMPPAAPHYTVPGRPPAHQPMARGGGETIEVQPGETLFSIARRHGVAVAAIKDANGLTNETVRPGQRLVIPSSPFDRAPLAKGPPPGYEPPTLKEDAPDRAPFAKTPSAARGLLPGAEPPPGWDGRYVMKNGDSLNGIAMRHGVSVDELMRANNITDPTRLWGGTVLAVPERQAALTDTPKGPPRVIQVPPKVINAVPDTPVTGTTKRSDVLSDAPAEFAGKFRWPARGKLVAGFGKRPDGKHNDGINIIMPLGTDIVAAEAGKVAYAGNELKGYGNLVLIRHPNGWVTAYAHADQLLVSYDQEVRRGQVIAKAGKTGSVDEPQLHFEIRRDARPVDPLPHLGN